MSIQVTDFKHIPGENDAEYIKLLQESLEREKAIARKAVAKIKEQDKMIDEQRDFITRQLQKTRAEYFREFERIASCTISCHAGLEHGERKYGMLSAIAVLTELGMKICKEET